MPHMLRPEGPRVHDGAHDPVEGRRSPVQRAGLGAHRVDVRPALLVGDEGMESSVSGVSSFEAAPVKDEDDVDEEVLLLLCRAELRRAMIMGAFAANNQGVGVSNRDGAKWPCRARFLIVFAVAGENASQRIVALGLWLVFVRQRRRSGIAQQK